MRATLFLTGLFVLALAIEARPGITVVPRNAARRVRTALRTVSTPGYGAYPIQAVATLLGPTAVN